MIFLMNFKIVTAKILTLEFMVRKNNFSIWNYKKRVSLEQITDIIGFRIILKY